jgi:dolichol-phosphate mannosyltransferase
MASRPTTRNAGAQRSAKPGIAVAIPCYRETSHIMGVLAGVGPEVDAIYVIDDCCPDKTGELVERECKDPRVRVIRHERNKGVGGATITGYRQALADGHDIIVKLDGDGQMDGALIPRLIQPVLDGSADYAKGNRFHGMHGFSQMPWHRIFGNLVLSLLSKFSSGYWNVLDPTNGFTAIHAEALKAVPLDDISEGYFFESDMLARLGLARAVVRDIPMVARYGSEVSGIRIPQVVPEFIFKHICATLRRLLITYFVRETNIATIQLSLSVVLIAFGVIFGAVNWIDAQSSGVPATAGTVVLAALPIILGSQLLIAFLNHDTRNVPSEPLQGLAADVTD